MKLQAPNPYGEWDITPHLVKPLLPIPVLTQPEMTSMATKHEGNITYLRFWNFWVRAATPASAAADSFFHNYESGAPAIWKLLTAIGAPTAWPQTQKEIWNRISTVWSWLAANVTVDNAAYGALVAAAGRWPSIEELATYYGAHGKLVWSACFSKAHLFALILGRVLPRWHTFIASAHHTEGGAPPTATHVFVGVYLTDRWYYLDPSAVYAGPLPSFTARKSVGIFASVDYEHPYDALPMPLSPLDQVPYLPA